MSNYFFLSIITTSCIFIGYLPEIYVRYNNIPENPIQNYMWICWLCAGFSGICYTVLNNEYYLMGNFVMHTSMNLLILTIKQCRVKRIRPDNVLVEEKTIHIREHNISYEDTFVYI